MSILDITEVEKLAKLSCLTLTPEELREFAQQLKTVLDFSETLIKIKVGSESQAPTKINVFREDTVEASEGETVLSVAPDTHDSYFIVPRVRD